jgi:xanthine dehydrogenase accessory factor
MKAETVAALQDARTNRRAVVLATRLSDAAETLVFLDKAEGALANDAAVVSAARRAMDIGRSETVDIGGQKIFLNVYVPPARLIIVGAVHIAQSLAPIATLLGFDVTVVDPRGAWATTSRFPGVKVVQDWADEAFETMGLDVSTAVVTLTHDPKLDDPALVAALRSDVFYVGALGSRRTHAKRKERLTEAGITEEQFARIHGPVGLNIGAKSPPRSAVSILGESSVRARRAKPWPVPRWAGVVRRDAPTGAGAILAHSWRASGVNSPRAACCRPTTSPSSRPPAPTGSRRGSIPTTCTKTKRRRRSPGRWPAKASRSRRRSPDGAIISPRKRAWRSSITSASMR